MAVIIPFPCLPPPPDELAAIWALSDELWPEYERALDGPAPPRLTLVR